METRPLHWLPLRVGHVSSENVSNTGKPSNSDFTTLLVPTFHVAKLSSLSRFRQRKSFHVLSMTLLAAHVKLALSPEPL